MPFDDLAVDLTLRQYAQPGETRVEQVLRRAADVVAPVTSQDFSDKIFSRMVTKKFSPGGRILAGAGTIHGNLLNCFVTDGNPYPAGSSDYALHLAQKLALITRVGGGNGLNLDSFPPKREYTGYTGTPYLLAHDADVGTGTYLDLVTGERVTKGYTTMLPIHDIPKMYDGAVIVVLDDTQDIWESAHFMVMDLLDGKDVYIDLRNLRPEGSPVSGSGGTSSGPASFAVEIFDNFARWASLGGANYAGPVATLRYLFASSLRVIRQGGVRRGAGMATLSASHPDIEDFITSKELRRERLEGDISTFNISVLVNDAIMQDDSDEAKRILNLISDQAWSTGEPGVLFVDTINENNILFPTEGPILATNPCGEIGLYPGEPCDLGAINVAEYIDPIDSTTMLMHIEDDAYMYARYLDAILDVENSPLPEIAEAIKSKRRIGLGMMGLADALIKLGIPYGSEEAQHVAWKIASAIRRGATAYSENAARVYGVPSSLEGVVPNRRNVALLTVAPTGTTAMVMGTTSGIEPLFSPFIYRRVGTEYKQILHPLFVEMMGDALGKDDIDWDYLVYRIGKDHGSVQKILNVPEKIRNVFLCAHDIDPHEHVLMQAAVQRGFDYDEGQVRWDGVKRAKTYAGNSISKTINLPKHTDVETIGILYELAWRLGLKGITVYRDGSRDLQVLNTTMEDDGSTSASQQQDEQLQEIVAASCSLDGTCDT